MMGARISVNEYVNITQKIKTSFHFQLAHDFIDASHRTIYYTIVVWVN